MIGSICLACQETQQRFSREEWEAEMDYAVLHQDDPPVLNEEDLIAAECHGANAAIGIILGQRTHAENHYADNDPRREAWQHGYDSAMADRQWYLDRTKLPRT